MDDDAPVLLGKLDVQLVKTNGGDNNNKQKPNSSCCYIPPISCFPELITTSSMLLFSQQQQQQQQQVNNLGAASSNSIKSSKQQQQTQQQQSIVLPSEDGASSLINRERSSWDVAALTAFRDGASVSSSTSNNNNNNKSSSSTSARETISQLLQSGRLPGTSSASVSSSNNSDNHIPSTVEILKSLDKFASNLGVSNEQEAAALRSLHFLHLLGYQRLQQLDGNLQILLQQSSHQSTTSSSNKKTAAASTTTTQTTVSDILLHQPFKMFDETTTNCNDASSSSSSADWVPSRSKLYDSLLQLTNEQQQKNEKQTAPKAFWATTSTMLQPTQKKSIEIQTSEHDQQQQGLVNWFHPENKMNTIKEVKANELVSCQLTRTIANNSNTTCLLSLIISVKKVVAVDRFVALENNTPVQIDETQQVKIPIRSNRVVVGRALTAGTIRARREQSTTANISDNNNNILGDDESSSDGDVSIDPWHIDLASAVRKLTKQCDHGLYISKEHFVLLLSENENHQQHVTILPCSRNMIRVNGSVVYAAPKTVRVGGEQDDNGIVITVGSGNTSPAGVVVQVRIVKE